MDKLDKELEGIRELRKRVEALDDGLERCLKMNWGLLTLLGRVKDCYPWVYDECILEGEVEAILKGE